MCQDFDYRQDYVGWNTSVRSSVSVSVNIVQFLNIGNMKNGHKKSIETTNGDDPRHKVNYQS